MMRAIILGAVLALAACGREAPAGCDLEVTRELAFTAADARDTLVAQAIGPSCDKLVGGSIARSSAFGVPRRPSA